jgi:hypothetical protein
MNLTISESRPKRVRIRQSGRRVQWARIVWWTSIANLAAVVLATLIIHLVSEHVWLTALAIYMPRVPFMAVALLLIPPACVWHRRSILINLLTVLVVLGPLMGFRAGTSGWFSGRAPKLERLRVVTCHVGDADGLPSALSEMMAIVPDLVVLQRVDPNDEGLLKTFDGWYQSSESTLFVSSRFPMQQLSVCRAPDSGQVIAVAYEIDNPAGRIRLVAVDQSMGDDPTEGFAFRALLFGSHRDTMRESLKRRALFTKTVRDFVDKHRAGIPMLVAGDFDSPVDGTEFRNSWSGWTNAFSEKGRGYGFTAPCRTPWYWPNGTPWLRVDHILVSDGWYVERSWTGRQSESSHRLLGAIVRIPYSPVPGRANTKSE